MEFLDRLGGSTAALRSLGLMVAIVSLAVVLQVASRFIVRHAMRRAVRRAWRGQGRWVARSPRPHDGSAAHQRRLQRADAAAQMMSRVSALVLVGLAVVFVCELAGVDPVVVVSSAGFLGAGIAVGGQSIIKDWLTGLLVLLEDRYAVGDRTTMRVGGEEIVGTVEMINGAGLRLRLENGATWHVGHGSIESVVNHSQQLVSHQIDLPSAVWDRLDPAAVGPALNAASHDLGLTDVVLVADVLAQASTAEPGTLTVQANRPLSPRQQELVRSKLCNLTSP